MRPVEQHLLDLPYVLRCEPPVVRAHHAEIDDRVRLDATGEIDIRLEVTERERARRRKQRPSSVKTRVTRASDRSPPCPGSIDEDDVTVQVDRFVAEHEPWIPLLLERRRRRKGRCEEMGSSAASP